MCNCEFFDIHFYMFNHNGNFGKGVSLLIDSDGIESDNAVYVNDPESRQKVRFNYCPMCGEKKDD